MGSSVGAVLAQQIDARLLAPVRGINSSASTCRVALGMTSKAPAMKAESAMAEKAFILIIRFSKEQDIDHPVFERTSALNINCSACHH
jgi:hypothetical protein